MAVAGAKTARLSRFKRLAMSTAHLGAKVAIRQHKRPQTHASAHARSSPLASQSLPRHTSSSTAGRRTLLGCAHRPPDHATSAVLELAGCSRGGRTPFL
ncbi:hypothetical protein PsYK624_066290 [Phanerochaete sordida]|uniref:Uncharacterized protein n=1 Tax=Phanerochaete sordida TaxID=48140 RepID=A0A9P3LCG8_9APHY|nr:hypothetical protein PsYK624_066290 [Phanerochaete sordida]